MDKTIALTVAGIIFTFVAAIHLYRLIVHIEIIVSGYVVPMSASYVGFVIAVILAIWMFKTSRS